MHCVVHVTRLCHDVGSHVVALVVVGVHTPGGGWRVSCWQRAARLGCSAVERSFQHLLIWQERSTAEQPSLAALCQHKTPPPPPPPLQYGSRAAAQNTLWLIVVITQLNVSLCV